MVVLLSQIKIAKNTIFVGAKNNNFKTLKELLIKKTQQIDYLEKKLELITIDNDIDNNRERRQVMTQISFLYCIYDTTPPQ